jgi:hypothetical protein
MASYSGASYFGRWFNATKRYLGLKFEINGKIHYGWTRLSVIGRQRITATLTGYAYETIPNKPINAGQAKSATDDPTNEDSGPGASVTNPFLDSPQPAALGLLALGKAQLFLHEIPEVTGRKAFSSRPREVWFFNSSDKMGSEPRETRPTRRSLSLSLDGWSLLGEGEPSRTCLARLPES